MSAILHWEPEGIYAWLPGLNNMLIMTVYPLPLLSQPGRDKRPTQQLLPAHTNRRIPSRPKKLHKFNLLSWKWWMMMINKIMTIITTIIASDILFPFHQIECSSPHPNHTNGSNWELQLTNLQPKTSIWSHYSIRFPLPFRPHLITKLVRMALVHRFWGEEEGACCCASLQGS